MRALIKAPSCIGVSKRLISGGRRVVVTGLGTCDPFSIGSALTSFDKVIEGQSGVGPLSRFKDETIPCKIAGEVKFDIENIDSIITPPKIKHSPSPVSLPRVASYALIAASEALKDSGLELTDEVRESIGVSIGTGIGPMDEVIQSQSTLTEKGSRRLGGYTVPRLLPNLPSGYVAMHFGLEGPTLASCTACAASAHAIGDAFVSIQRGQAERMLAGGTEASLLPLTVFGFARAKALSTSFNDRPAEASRPWDADRDGFVPSEGASMLVLESLESAKKRGARIYAEICGYGASGDAIHLTSPAEDGRGGLKAMRNAFIDSGLGPDDVDYVNAHATSTPLGDLAEAKAIASLFSNRSLKNFYVSSTKGHVGHLLGAAGAFEAMITILALYRGQIPATLNLSNPSPDLPPLNYVPKSAITPSSPPRAAMSNSFGFGGTNATLLFRRI